MDWTSNCEEEEEAVLEIPDLRIRERVPVQRLCVQAKEVGAGPKSELNRKTGKRQSVWVYIVCSTPYCLARSKLTPDVVVVP